MTIAKDLTDINVPDQYHDGIVAYIADKFVAAERHKRVQEKYTELQKEYETVTSKAAEADKLSAEVKRLSISLSGIKSEFSAIEALEAENANNPKRMLKFLERNEETGEYDNLEEQIQMLKTEDAWAFNTKATTERSPIPSVPAQPTKNIAPQTPKIRGLKPANQGREMIEGEGLVIKNFKDAMFLKSAPAETLVAMGYARRD